MRILILYTGELGRKVIQNLVNSSNFCGPAEIYVITVGTPESHMHT